MCVFACICVQGCIQKMGLREAHCDFSNCGGGGGGGGRGGSGVIVSLWLMWTCSPRRFFLKF